MTLFSNRELAGKRVSGMVAEVVGYQGKLVFDTSKPEKTFCKDTVGISRGAERLAESGRGKLVKELKRQTGLDCV